MPSCLFDCDKVYASFESEMTPKLAKPPSHYWFENCYATFIEDPSGLRQLDLIGTDKVLWGSDYPHPESAVGLHPAIAVGRLRRLRLHRRRPEAIVGGNGARQLWGLD